MKRSSNESRRQRLLVVMVTVMALTLSIFLAACGGSDSDEAAADQTKAAATEQVESTEPTEASSEKKKEKKEEKTEAEAQETTQAEETERIQPTQKATKAKADKDKSAKQNKENKESTKATKPKKQVCYITVEGYCSSKEIAIQSGDTVYDILKRTGVAISAKNTGQGLYIEAINGLAEFDKGPTSGWKYSVNGTEPGYDCDSYAVKPGDKINWYYALEA